jgi:hypothetical protein
MPRWRTSASSSEPQQGARLGATQADPAEVRLREPEQLRRCRQAIERLATDLSRCPKGGRQAVQQGDTDRKADLLEEHRVDQRLEESGEARRAHAGKLLGQLRQRRVCGCTRSKRGEIDLQSEHPPDALLHPARQVGGQRHAFDPHFQAIRRRLSDLKGQNAVIQWEQPTILAVLPGFHLVGWQALQGADGLFQAERRGYGEAEHAGGRRVLGIILER